MSRILFYMKQSRHRADSLSFMRKLEAQGFFCRMCGKSDGDDRGGEFFPVDFEKKGISFSGGGTSEISCGEGQETMVPNDGKWKVIGLDGERCLSVGLGGEECSSVGPDGEKCPLVGADGEECPSVSPTGEERALVITDDAVVAGICELRKIACIGYCPPELEETGSEDSDLSGDMERDPAAEAEKESVSEENGESGYFPHVRMVWESFAGREPEELEQFRCRFYGEPVVIARTERLLIRESVPEDFDAIYRMESDMVSEQELCEDRKKICSCSAAGDSKKERKEDRIAGEIICFHEEREKFCSYIKNVYPFYGYGYWTVELTESGREGTVLGRCGLKDYEPGEDDGYVVMKKEAGDELMRKSILVLPQESEFEEEAESEICCSDCLPEFRQEIGSELQQVFPPELFCLELGYIVAKPYHRQGYAYEMCRAVLDYAFAVLRADMVMVRIHPQNKASLELARKLGLAGFSFL